MSSLEPPSTRKRGKCAPCGVGSALALERHLGFRLRQVRRAETVLGVYDVMRLAGEEFDLSVSRDIARQWLAACGAAALDPEKFVVIRSRATLESRCGAVLRADGFLQRYPPGFRGQGPQAVVDFHLLFSHLQVSQEVLLSWAGAAATPAAVDVSQFRARRKQNAPKVRSYEHLVEKCGHLLDAIFDAEPFASPKRVSELLKECHIEVPHKKASFLGDYVTMRSLGLHSQPLLSEVPEGAAASLRADLHLHREGVAGAQRSAAKRGFLFPYNAILHWKHRKAAVRNVTA